MNYQYHFDGLSVLTVQKITHNTMQTFNDHLKGFDALVPLKHKKSRCDNILKKFGSLAVFAAQLIASLQQLETGPSRCRSDTPYEVQSFSLRHERPSRNRTWPARWLAKQRSPAIAMPSLGRTSQNYIHLETINKTRDSQFMPLTSQYN